MNKSEISIKTTTKNKNQKQGMTELIAEENIPADEKPEKQPDDFNDDVNYKDKYRTLKRKLKSLLYEQECFHEELRKIQRKCLRVSRDKSFLLDRLLQYEQPELSSDEELTDSSDDEEEKPQITKKQISKTSKQKSKTVSNASSGSKNSDKIRCKQMENGKQCSKLVSKKIVSGICQTHRQQANKSKVTETKKETSSKADNPAPVKRVAGGGKDIGQFREAMEASQKELSDSEANEEEDELIIDVPH